MSTVESETAIAAAPTVYTVTGVLEKASLIGHNTIFKKSSGVFKVKGVVSKVKRYKSAIYFYLFDGDHTLSVKVPAEDDVYDGERVIVEGLLLLKPSRFMTGLEAIVDGHIVGNWEARERRVDARIALDKECFVRIEDYVVENGVSGFLLLGSETGIRDVLSSLGSGFRNSVASQSVRVSARDSLVADLTAAITPNTRAFAIVRGGDDNTLSIWNDAALISHLLSFNLPFYLALGHSHMNTLADRFADEVFHTPSALGASLGSALRRASELASMKVELERLGHENKKLRGLYDWQKNRSQKYRKWLFIGLIVVALVVLVNYLS